MAPALTILGSAAAEGYPAMFCGCPGCQAAWKNGGKDIRLRTAYKISERVRVDFGPDTLAQEYKFNLHSENLRHLFITHPHEDHLYNQLLGYRVRGFSSVPEGHTLTIHGSKGSISTIMQFLWGANLFRGDLSAYQIKTHIWEYFETIVPEGEDMEFIPLPARHYFDRPNIGAAIYVIRNGSKWILIGNDTGYFPDETWKFLEEKKFHFDIVVLDCTYGTRTASDGHMGGERIFDVRNRLETMGSASAETKFVVNHFTHNCRNSHAELEAYFNPRGIAVGWDGMEL